MENHKRETEGRYRATRVALAGVGILACAIVGWHLGSRTATTPKPADPHPQKTERLSAGPARSLTARRPPRHTPETPAETTPPGAIPGEAVLRFSSEEALRQFLANPPKGIRVLASESRLRAARIAYDDPAALDALRDSPESGIEYNLIVSVPELPDPDQVASLGPAAPFGDTALEWLGAADRPPTWGANIRVAVLDSGVRSHPALAGVPIRSIDLIGGGGNGDYSGHGTAVASLLAGSAGGIYGVAPGVEIFDIRVLDGSGIGDSFTLATGILRAADMGAQVITLSLGTYGDSPLLRDAINYALSKNIAVVAAAGNEGYANLSYPARYPGVIAVGAVDATGTIAPFSNSGERLAIVAPGTAITAAWLDGRAIAFSGTSAAVPLVGGAIAYVLADQRSLSPAAAADIVLQNANETGPPGADPAYGQGTLDLERLSQRRTMGLHDLAVASHWIYASDAGAQGAIPVQVTVQNRGTVTESYSILTVTDGRSTRRFTLPSLDPGTTATSVFHLDPSGGDSPPFIQSSVSRPGVQDYRPDNNTRTSILSPPGTDTP